jgi:acyl-CoA thioesterase II
VIERDPPAPVVPDGGAGTMSLEDVMAAVEACLALAEIVPGVWQGPNVLLPGYRRLFGGQLLAQAIAAAATSGDARKLVRSLHLVFVAEGRPEAPVDWSAASLHDGRTFATRSVIARQGGRVLASGVVSLHVPDSPGEAGGRVLDHSIAPPSVAAPPALASIGQLGAMAFETRPVPASEPTAPATPHEPGSPVLDGLAVGPPELAVWMRACRAPASVEGTMPQVRHQELLAYASDLTMMVAAMRPHAGVGFGAPVVAASAVTSHTISFHRQIRVDDWLLFVQESPAAANGRAYIRGDMFDVSGTVVASCAQEVLIRVVAGA